MSFYGVSDPIDLRCVKPGLEFETWEKTTKNGSDDVFSSVRNSVCGLICFRGSAQKARVAFVDVIAVIASQSPTLSIIDLVDIILQDVGMLFPDNSYCCLPLGDLKS